MATYAAASVNRSDVQAAVDRAGEGDTVTIPAGSANYSSMLNMGAKGLMVQGAGVGKTIITVTANGSHFQFGQHATFTTRITGIEFHGAYDNNRSNVYVGGNPGDALFRIDHCRFLGTVQAVFLFFDGGGRGLVDHCSFECDGPPSEMVKNVGYGNGSDSGWMYSVKPGSDDAVYIEDCTFISLSAGPYASGMQNYYGSRTVFRHNQLDMCQFDNHGTPGARGGRWFEVYENTYTTHAGDNQSDYMSLRAGSGVVFNNRHTGPNDGGGQIKLEEEDGGSYPQQDQIGRGKDQSPDPLYIWGNTSNGLAMNIGNNTPSLIQLNRDYHLMTKPGYQPYTYPHPLASGGESVPVPPDEPPLMSGLSFQAEAGEIEAPFGVSGGLVLQTISTMNDPMQGGRARWRVTIPSAGEYVVKMRVNAPDTGADSIFIDFDREPVLAAKWGIQPVTSGVEERTAGWMGSGSDASPEFSPKVWVLSAGEHTLYVRGREMNCGLDSVTIEPVAKPPNPNPGPTTTVIKGTVSEVDGVAAQGSIVIEVEKTGE